MAATVKGLTIKIDGDVGGLTGALASVQKESNKLSKDLGKIGGELTRKVTIPIVAGFTAAIKTTADFEKEMAKVQAVSKADAKEMEILTARAREMGATTLHSATDAADAMYYMGLAGWNATEIYEGLPAVLDLATASGEDLASVSDIVTDALTAFGLEAKDTQHFVDVLAETTRDSNTDIMGLGEAFKYVAPVAGAMNYSVEDVALALGLMANNGIKASMGGTALRNIIQRLAKPTKESALAMDKLNLSAEDVANMSLAQVMERLRDSFSDLVIPSEEVAQQINLLNEAMESGEITEEEYTAQLEDLMAASNGAGNAEKVRYAAMLAGARGMPGLLAIVNTAEKDYAELANAISDADGATRDMASIMESTTSGQFTLLISQLKETAMAFGELLIPYVQKGIEKLSEIVQWFSGLDSGTKKAILTFAALAAAVGPLLSTLSLLAAAIGFIASPIGLVVVAITALVAAFVYLWNTNEKFRNNVIKLWENIKRIVTNAVTTIKTTVMNVFSGIPQTVQNIFNRITDGIRSKLESAKSIVQNIVNSISRIFKNANWSLPKIKLPHFSVTAGKTVLGVTLPKISVSWYRKAYDNPYLFTSPTIVGNRGFGDGGGSGELVYGRDQLMRDIAAASQGDITINVYASDGMDVNQLAVKVQNRLAQLQKQRVSVYA